MTRTRKWLLGTGIAIGVLVALLAAGSTWLLYTTSGLRFALDRGVAMMHGQLAYATAHGTLGGEATVSDLHYRDADGTTLRIARASVDLQPWALLARRLHLRKARVSGITLDLAPSRASRRSGEFSLTPPLTILLDDAHLEQIVVRENGKPAFAADSLAIAGRWSHSNIVLRELSLQAPAGSAELQGTLAIARGYRGHGKASFDWKLDDTRYRGSITSRSDGRTAELHATLEAPTRVVLDASVKLDKRRAWTLSLDVPAFDPGMLPALPSSLHELALRLGGAGDAHGGKLQGRLAVNGHVALIDPAQFRYDGKSISLDPLRLRSPTKPGAATATGSVRLGARPIAAALDIDWQDVRLPADIAGQPLDTHGKVHLAGSLQQFALTGALAIGPPGKLADLTLDLAGTPGAIQLNALKLVQEQGGLDAHGSIGLQPGFTWKLDAVAHKLDPGAILAGWDGAMDFTLATAGRLTAQGPQATVKLDKVGGTLRGRSIAGSRADLAITPGNLLDGSLVLVAGRSRIEARGTGGPRTNAIVDLDVASLGDWLPDASGKLHGRFTLKGTWPRIAVAGSLQGDALKLGARDIDRLRFTASLPDLSRPGGDLDLALDGVHAPGFDFDLVRITGRGDAARHRLHLQATGKPLGVAMTVQGSWNAGTRRWTGTLDGVELTPQGTPAWHQQQPAALGWQNGAASISRFCLAADASRLCLSGERDARGALTAQYDLQALPLQMLASLVPGADRLQASGDISGSGHLALAANGSLTGNATLAAGAGRIAFASTVDQPLLAWSSIELDVDAEGANQRLTLRGALADGGHIDGQAQMRGSAHALAGHIDVDLRNLAFISALSPEIANVKGSLTGGLQLGGTLAQPQFQGRIQTHGFAAELPRAGLKLHDGVIAVSGDPQGRLAITGQLASGQGVVHIDGSAGFAADAPMTLHLQGKDVLVVDIPAAHVVASPDLHIGRADGVFSVTGSVAIPSADVKVEKLPGQGPAQASPDVVIVDAPPAKEVTPLAMQADIELKLGDKVKVQGYGLDGSVHGQLALLVRPGQTAVGRGEIRVAGKYEAYGQNLTIERGRLLFAGTPLDNPGLDIRAVRTLRSQDVTVGLSVRGTAKRPVLTVFSDPAMEQAEALSYLVTGRPLSALKSGEGDTLNTAAQALGGLAGDRLAKSIGSRLGLEAGVSSSEALGGSAFTAGKYLSPRLFLSYGVGLFTPGEVITLRYTLNRFLQFEAENATTGNRASFNYKIEK